MIRFISFEGGDGSGKTTQLKLLADYLSKRGYDCLCTREPGGTDLGKLMRRVLLEAGDSVISRETELFLYLADRAQHVQEIIRPALAAGKIVLCDRFTDSTVAYQGYGREADLRVLGELNRMASGGLVPDLTFLLDCPADLGLSRTANRMKGQRPGEREDRFEREEAEFHARVRRGFQELARSDPSRVRRLDASRPIEDLHAEIRSIVEQEVAR
ncbi:MAG TPA: dTMP kinase [Verrucomicrobiae bacterium]|nr:dTMP kinase [Verrucomicrobiae bacterium]